MSREVRIAAALIIEVTVMITLLITMPTFASSDDPTTSSQVNCRMKDDRLPLLPAAKL